MINISDEYYKILTNKFCNNALLKALIEALYNNKTVVMLDSEYCKTKHFFKINDFNPDGIFKLYLTSKNNEQGELFIYENEGTNVPILDYKGKRTIMNIIILTNSFDDILEHML